MAEQIRILPTVNLNGTSHEELGGQWLAVYKAAQALNAALAAATPHGRDYQTAPEGEFQLARYSHLQLAGYAVAIEHAALETAMHIHQQED